MVVDEILMHQYEHGASGRGMILATKQFNRGISIIFPWYPLTNWCVKNLGWKFFLKNMDYFFQINLEGFFSLFFDLIHSLFNSKK